MTEADQSLAKARYFPLFVRVFASVAIIELNIRRMLLIHQKSWESLTEGGGIGFAVKVALVFVGAFVEY
jgi:hypothetical protein